MRRLLNVPFLTWLTVVLLFAAAAATAVLRPAAQVPPHPYPSSRNTAVDHALALHTTLAVLPDPTTDRGAAWCTGASGQARTFAEDSPQFTDAFNNVADAVDTYCTHPARKPAVSVAGQPAVP